MYFSEDLLNKLKDEFALLQSRYNTLLLTYHQHKYRCTKSAEYAEHGFMRRLGTLLRCVQNVFEILPPDRGDGAPPRSEVLDATINIQAFVFNLFGAIDNLAWVWVSETGLCQKDGSPLPSAWIGLGPGNTFVRESLPVDFREYLSSTDSWFKHLENFRHALAHRIPLYIPPYTVDPKREFEWQQLERNIAKAIFRGDHEEANELKRAQDEICVFRPLMLHSYTQKSRPIIFHPQLIADFLTIEELALKFQKILPIGDDMAGRMG